MRELICMHGMVHAWDSKCTCPRMNLDIAMMLVNERRTCGSLLGIPGDHSSPPHTHTRSSAHAHLSICVVLDDETVTPSIIQVPHSMPTRTPARGPISGARKLTSSTMPSWNLALGGRGIEDDIMPGEATLDSGAEAREQLAPRDASFTCMSTCDRRT